MASISSLGLSGLPLNDLLGDLRKVEEAPLQLLTARKRTFESKISSYGTLSNALSTFQTAAKALTEAKTYNSLKTTVSNTEALTAKAAPGSGAVAGTYNIEVLNLATTQTVATGGQASRTDALSASGGTLTFTLGDGSTKTLELTAEQTSLESIRSAINASDLGLTATLINNGDDTAPFQLSISTTATGTDARIASISADNADLTAVLGYDEANLPGSAVSEVRTAVNASIRVNGIGIASGSNTLSDAIEGVELTLKAETDAGKPLTLTIEEDQALTRTTIENFVNTYNALQTTIRNLTRYNVETQQSSALTGDSIARSVQTQMRSIMGSLVSGEGSIGTLSQMGITTNVNTGALTIDADKLTAALDNNMASVQSFFSGENGLVAKLNTRIDTMLGDRGIIRSAQDGARTSMKTIDTQYASMQSRIDQKMASYQKQFVELEKFMSQMNGIGSYLTSQLGMLEALSKGSNNNR